MTWVYFLSSNGLKPLSIFSPTIINSELIISERLSKDTSIF